MTSDLETAQGETVGRAALDLWEESQTGLTQEDVDRTQWRHGSRSVTDEAVVGVSPVRAGPCRAA